LKIVWLCIALAWGLAALPAAASVESELAFHRGVVAFGDERYDDARAAFEKVLAEDSEDAAAIQYLGLIAQEQGDPDGAVEHFERALALEPDNTDLRLDLGSALLEAGRIEEAQAAFDAVLAARPDDARANLFAGIAAYRTAEYQKAIESLDRAKKLDPSLASHATYYAGLSAAFLGDFGAAEGAFSAVEEQSPLSPLSRSAESLRQQITPGKAEPKRPWSLALTAGGEWDSNPTFAGENDPLLYGTADQKDDFRGVFRIRGSYQLLDLDQYSLTAGYDGYLSLHHKTDNVDLQTHVGWLSGAMNHDPVRFGLRYDYAYTMIRLSHKFRSLHRITPSVTYRQSDWGVAQAYYQWQNADFLRHIENPIPRDSNPLDRDSNRYTFGVNQFLFLPDVLPQQITYLRIGALGEMNRADSSDFSYDACEVSAGAAADLVYGIQFTTLYRFMYRDYRSTNFFPTLVPGNVPREDFQHRLSVEVSKAITDNIELSVAFEMETSDVSRNPDRSASCPRGGAVRDRTAGRRRGLRRRHRRPHHRRGGRDQRGRRRRRARRPPRRGLRRPDRRRRQLRDARRRGRPGRAVQLDDHAAHPQRQGQPRGQGRRRDDADRRRAPNGRRVHRDPHPGGHRDHHGDDGLRGGGPCDRRDEDHGGQSDARREHRPERQGQRRLLQHATDHDPAGSGAVTADEAGAPDAREPRRLSGGLPRAGAERGSQRLERAHPEPHGHGRRRAVDAVGCPGAAGGADDR
jgi:tetratricopeptide (TPR) repeat protein